MDIDGSHFDPLQSFIFFGPVMMFIFDHFSQAAISGAAFTPRRYDSAPKALDNTECQDQQGASLRPGGDDGYIYDVAGALGLGNANR